MLYDSYDVAISTLSCSDYWTLIPRSALSLNGSTLTHVPIKHNCTNIEIDAIWSKNQTANGVLSILINELKKLTDFSI